jgi:hypothetical protein
MFTLQTTFVQGGWGGVVHPFVEVTVKSREEDFCPSYVQEFGLVQIWGKIRLTMVGILFVALPGSHECYRPNKLNK